MVGYNGCAITYYENGITMFQQRIHIQLFMCVHLPHLEGVKLINQGFVVISIKFSNITVSG